MRWDKHTHSQLWRAKNKLDSNFKVKKIKRLKLQNAKEEEYKLC